MLKNIKDGIGCSAEAEKEQALLKFNAIDKLYSDVSNPGNSKRVNLYKDGKLDLNGFSNKKNIQNADELIIR